MKNVVILALVITNVVMGIFLWQEKVKDQDVSIERRWESYMNTAYGYQIEYPIYVVTEPESAYVANRAEADPTPVSESGDIQVSIPGSITSLVIKAYNSSEPLNQFAKSIHQLQMYSIDPYIKNKRVGALKEVVFGMKKGYSFTLTGSFKDFDGEFGLRDGDTFNFVFIENNMGKKLLIYYPADDEASARIASSLYMD